MRFKEVKKVYEEIYEKYETIIPLLGIYAELREFEPELDDDQMEFLIDAAMEIYWNYEYSTPTGVGVVIRNMLSIYFDTTDLGEEVDFNDIFTYDNIMDEYEWSEWK